MMNQEFYHCLEAYQQSGNGSNESVEQILQLRSNSPAIFFQNILSVLDNPCDVRIKTLAIILTYQIFPSDLNGLLSLKEIITLPLIQEFVSRLYTAFENDDVAYRQSAAHLCGEFINYDIAVYQSFNFASQLISTISRERSYNFIDSAYQAIEFLFENSNIDSLIPNIIQNIFSMFVPNGVAPHIASSSFTILRKLLKLSTTFFESDSNVLALFQILNGYLQFPDCQTSIARLSNKFIQLFYHNFLPSSELMIPQLAQLLLSTPDANLKYRICQLFTTISQIEYEIEESVITAQYSEPIISSLFVTASSPQDAGYVNSLDSDPANFATNALYSCFLATPNAEAIFISLFQQYVNSENFGEREVSLSILTILLSKDVPPIPELFGLIITRISDPIPRVQQNALYSLCAYLKVTSEYDIGLVSNLMLQIISNSEANAEIIEPAMRAAKHLILQGSPATNNLVLGLVQIAIGGDLPLSNYSIKSLTRLCEKMNPDFSKALFTLTFNLFETNLQTDTPPESIERIACILYSSCTVPFESAEQVSKIMSVFSGAIQKFPDLADELVVPIASIASNSQSFFAPFLSETISLVLRTASPTSLSHLIIYYDLQPWGEQIFGTFIPKLMDENTDLMIKGNIMNAINNFTRKWPIPPTVADALVSASHENIQQLRFLTSASKDEIERLLLFFLQFFEMCVNRQIKNDITIIQVIIELCETVGSMKNANEKLVSIAVRVIARLFEAFPVEMSSTARSSTKIRNLLEMEIQFNPNDEHLSKCLDNIVPA